MITKILFIEKYLFACRAKVGLVEPPTRVERRRLIDLVSPHIGPTPFENKKKKMEFGPICVM